jgi:Acyl-protein synthetase, LuxE
VNVSPSLEKLLAAAPYSLPQEEKRALLTERTRDLTRHHYERCEPYRILVDRIFGGTRALEFERLEDAPFLPVSLFKTRELRSVEPGEVVKTLTSSGTSGQPVSRIHLDAGTAQLQSRTLVKILQHFLGVGRRPMVILDHSAAVRDRRSFSARAAGILGILPFGRQPFYALREDMSLDLDGLEAYLERMRGQPSVLFGFTFIIWQYFVAALEQQGRRLALPDAVLLHSGGWKKVESLRVSPDDFRRRVLAVAGIETVLNYYGMVEQVGSVYFENPLHFLQASVFSDVIVRDTNTLAPLPPGRPGLIQVVSALPMSYPGHSLLTEDLGIVEGCDSQATGMNGQYFQVLGRLPRAELRGCSDTFQRPVGAPQ